MADDNEDTGDTIPRARLNAEADKRRAAEAAVVATKAEAAAAIKAAQDAAAAEIGTHRTAAAKLESDLTALRAKYDIERAGFSHGLDADGIAAAVAVHAQIPDTAEKPRPPFEAWLPTLKAEGATVPRPLQGYFGAQAAATKTIARPTGSVAQTSTGDGADVGTIEEVRAKIERIQAHGKQTGDWSEWKSPAGQALRARVLQQQKGS